MEELKNRNDYSKAMMPDGLVVLEGVTTTCPNCKAIAPKVDELMKKYPDARFYQYNVDVAEDIAQELGARQVPNFSCFVDGMIVDGVTGAKPTELEKLIKENYDGKVVE
ncbi:hypothetical protein PMZ80_009642 [Knufia obscura]|uniref:Thioredoxin domain-containing protein n=2 Tax=Knufia TaxID=430999 RepID=A0AAN8ESA0_9EURO|nr:hypothetical protein PMZ80_009642 [Knufia obscura]KAK5951073.1 hypothetical protein OHC33_007826 [Knufia fluminis]